MATLLKTPSFKKRMFALLGCAFLATGLHAQDVAPAAPTAYDPIVATLDSLVNQCFIQRISSGRAADAAGMDEQVPSYSDDIYSARISRITSPIPYTFNDEVKSYIELYGLRRRALLERTMGLAQLYFPLFEQVLDQQDLPIELKYLSIVESALNPKAVSPVGATGLWQFMLATGRLYGLKTDSYIDQRRDPVASTYAACQYFKDMYAVYGDWLLVIASYNCGPGNVNRAIQRSGGKKTFWEISPYLPSETRGYVPAFIAVTYLMNYSAEHNLTAVAPLIDWFQVDTVQVNYRVDLHTVAEAVGVPYDVLTYLNPVYKKGIVPNSESAQTIRLPLQSTAKYLAAEEGILKSSAPMDQLLAIAPASDDNGQDDMATETVRKTHRVKRGEHLQTIANRYHCTVSQLKKWNGLRSTRLSIGQSLKVFVSVTKKSDAKPVATAKVAQPDTAATVSQTATSADSSVQNTSTVMTVTTPVDPQFIYHVVAPGDTLWKIAQRYEGLTVDKIKEINQLNSNEIKVGTKLKVSIGG